MSKRSLWRPAKNWEIAKEVACLLDGILPAEVCSSAIATCQFTIQAPNSVGATKKNWGEWVRTRLQTFGQKLNGLAAATQSNGNWLSFDSREAANIILGAFGLSLDSIYEAYGMPEEGQKMTLDLPSIIQRLAPEFLSAAKAA
jgi:hypothetical protein